MYDDLSHTLSKTSENRRSKMDTKDNNALPSKVHIVVFPFPAKGHINPSLHFCKRLASKGFKITLVTVVSAYKTFKTKATSLMIDIETIPDCAEDTTNWDIYFRTFKESAAKNMAEYIQKKLRSSRSSSSDDDNDSPPPPKLVMYDSMMPWMLDIAHGFGLPGACFFTQSCSVNAVYYHMHNGAAIFKKTPPSTTTEEDDTVVSLPFLPPLKSKDLPEFAVFNEYTDVVSNLHSNQFSNIDKIDYILFNTFYELELEVANWMISKWSILTVGPTVSLIPDRQQRLEMDECSNYLFETNKEACLKWLDERETDSVIYVSYGSFVTLKEEQMEEVAQGIASSNYNFLWVVRDEEDRKLPKDFKSKTSEKGLIINWCPQLDVLGHRAVACFMTHCGWNSTLEALTAGVPMIAMPGAADQTNNAKFVEDVWKAGVRVKVNENGIVGREEIEQCIRQVTAETEKGKELRRNAMKWKELAKQAVSEGGSTDRNIEEFASKLMLL